VSLDLLFLTKLLPRADVIGRPILIYHRIKNLSSMGIRFETAKCLLSGEALSTNKRYLY